MYVIGNYSYIADEYGGLQIIDITDPSAPIFTGGVHTIKWAKDVFISGNYAFVADDEGGLKIIDISNPSIPVLIGYKNTPGSAIGVTISANLAYVADYDYGLQVLDVSDPSSPTVVRSFDNTLEHANGVDVRGSYAYVADRAGILHIVDISNPSSPTPVGKCVFPGTERVAATARGVHVSGNYAYVAAWSDGLKIIDISNPSSPNPVGNCGTVGLADDVYIKGNYAYVACLYYDGSLSVLDVSDPTNASLLGYTGTSGSASGVYVVDNYAYVANGEDGLQVIDVSHPSVPTLFGNCDTTGWAHDVFVVGNYAYVADDEEVLRVIDVSHPSVPTLVGHCDTTGCAQDVFVVGGYAYLAVSDKGLQVIDVSNPAAPSLVGSYDTPGEATGVFVRGNYAYVADGDSGKLIILYIDKSSTSPRIHLNRSKINFASGNSGAATPAQSLFITNIGGGSLDWTASTDQDWLNCSPGSGTNNGEILVTVNTIGLLKGKYTGTVSVSDPDASNSPQTVEVTLTVFGVGHTEVPFGVYATPVDGTTVSGSIPVTGWVLDDIGVQNVQIFREEGKNLVFIGDAVFVEGARPDVEQAYPSYPNNSKAGWGYMMLTNFLPNGGNGTFKIHAVATDIEGNQVTLGIKTIIADNANAVKPFGAIDTPGQGGTASGSDFVNFGWALTPPPNTIPLDGSTINVWVDGVSLGNPGYNRYREDIAALFPGYNNSNGAGGYFYLDTTPYENGVHTIQWTVTDDAGNTDGIGSRYFSILDSSQSAGRTAQSAWRQAQRAPDVSKIPIDYSQPLLVKKGYNPEIAPKTLYPDENGQITIKLRELERVEIQLSNNHWKGYQVIGSQLRSLPIGSFLDAETGIFSWIPGPGYYGMYTLLFINRGMVSPEEGKKYLVRIEILPRY